ncbi:MAG: hypothetical protein AAFU64_18240, partial [Bacteroidota bacterium]
MIRNLVLTFLLYSIVFFPRNAFAQPTIWEDVSYDAKSQLYQKFKSEAPVRRLKMSVEVFRDWMKDLSPQAFYQAATLGKTLALPLPDGSWHQFQV